MLVQNPHFSHAHAQKHRVLHPHAMRTTTRSARSYIPKRTRTGRSTHARAKTHRKTRKTGGFRPKIVVVVPSVLKLEKLKSHKTDSAQALAKLLKLLTTS